MSNLGGYQKLTTVAKKVGGPRNLKLLLFGVGGLFGVGVTEGKYAIKKKKALSEKEKKRQSEEMSKMYTVEKKGRSNEGLLFEEGDTFKVLEVDGDVVLIEKIGDDNNPYYVSRQFLDSISDYELE
ncbi:hypothetical protein SAMN02910289_00367 [Lachnospiraceae bacterium RM5]|nr:hypothetical protein SAMN02910289_00367 [Lachnospiraceae bacterium RM5]